MIRNMFNWEFSNALKSDHCLDITVSVCSKHQHVMKIYNLSWSVAFAMKMTEAIDRLKHTYEVAQCWVEVIKHIKLDLHSAMPGSQLWESQAFNVLPKFLWIFKIRKKNSLIRIMTKIEKWVIQYLSAWASPSQGD